MLKSNANHQNAKTNAKNKRHCALAAQGHCAFTAYHLVQAGKVTPECRVPLGQELRWLSQYRDIIKDKGGKVLKEFEDRYRLLKALESGNKDVLVEVDRVTLLTDGGKWISDVFAKSDAILDDSLERLRRSPPSQAPCQLEVVRGQGAKEEKEQVKLTWKQPNPKEGEATILGWR
eukprot:1280058-Pyramimonas_sp.AAC.1